MVTVLVDWRPAFLGVGGIYIQLSTDSGEKYYLIPKRLMHCEPLMEWR